jgi:hypothetical protein
MYYLADRIRLPEEEPTEQDTYDATLARPRRFIETLQTVRSAPKIWDLESADWMPLEDFRFPKERLHCP